jgi:hypothetical protein
VAVIVRRGQCASFIACGVTDAWRVMRAVRAPRGRERQVQYTLISVVSMPTKTFQSVTRITGVDLSPTETFLFPSEGDESVLSVYASPRPVQRFRGRRA